MSELYSGAEYDKPREECGVVAVYTSDHSYSTATITYELLQKLQHRGQDAAGILVTGKETIMLAEHGTINEVFPNGATELDDTAPEAHIGIAHVRYSTSGEGIMPYGGFAFNGNIANFQTVADAYDVPYEYRANDGVGMSYILTGLHEKHGDYLSGLHELLPQLQGGYAIVATDGNSVFGARDPHGLKPLSIGRINSDENGFVLVSEDVALQDQDMSLLREVAAGEIVAIDEAGIRQTFLGAEIDEKFCMFEAVYYMNKDSSIRGQKVESIRHKLGFELAMKDREMGFKPDFVVGVPQSGLPGAEGYADGAGVPLVPGLLINPDYEKGRSFIMATQEERRQAVRDKLVVDAEYVAGKKLVVVDDSIVRSTTKREIVRMLREAGAVEVHSRITAPPIKMPCFYGVNMGHEANDLIAANMHFREMATAIDADSIMFLDETEMARGMGVALGKLCMGCVLGEYPTPVPMPDSRKNQQIPPLVVQRVA